MIDHLFGRPNPYWKRAQVFMIIFFWLWRIIRGNPKGLPLLWLRSANRKLKRFTPWQIVASTLTAVYVVRNFDKILGLQSPEPLARLYSPSYYRATWINTGLDAGFATAMSIRTKWIRDICSVIFSGYYIIYPNEADEKLRRFRAVPTVEMLRRCWEKTSNPYIRAFTHLPRVTIRKKILLPRPASSTYERPITGFLFFALPEKQLSKATDLILDFPGGGFVAMSPEHHEERLRMWAVTTGKPILSIDYGKAPEYPYPFAIDEAFDTYKVLVESVGALLGMSGKKLNILLSGDSAGASVTANVVFRIIEHNENPANRLTPLPQPIALVFNYAALDFNFTSWMTPDNLRVLRTEESSGSFPGLKELAAQKDHLKHISPLSMVGDKRPGVPRRKPLKRQTSWKDTIRGLTTSGGEKEEDTSSTGPKKRRSSSALKTPSSRRSTFLEPRHRPESLDGVDTPEAESDQDEQDFDQYREEDRPLQARVRYVYPESSLRTKVPIPRSKSAVVQQQHELSVAVEEANTKATERYGGKGKQREPIGTRLTMTSRTGYFQDRIITPSMMRAMAILYIGPHRNPDFATDYHLSPLLAPSHVLAQFPPILMQCGEKDPLVDDTVIFAGRVREAKRARRVELDLAISGKSARFGETLRMSNAEAPVDIAALKRERDRLSKQTEEDWVQLVIWSEWSHGYLQMSSLMAEAKAVIEELAEWIDGAFERYSSVSTPILPPNRRRESPAPARKPVPEDSFSTSETETDDTGITFVPRRRSPPESLNGGPRGSRGSFSQSPTETTPEPDSVEVGHSRIGSETEGGQRRPAGLAITETELMRRRRLLDAHIFE
ncbi:Alpha/Beta hydrolase protein [Mycena alexandri]|uniref:Alpha/Beta hydrolase protein n=1 Tax=Mycena alexandri TaxID=1745969 RepID=A0AAD6TIV1_9AGAR|nr:Alpha/Beta hydrolase protein [Mycena alexandri]